ncbi:MAG: hypothetical protein KF724_06960 [Phycisphaeraceae bacterium]|nr:hypothetical protein [Phycisphaeraceae bacterium]
MADANHHSTNAAADPLLGFWRDLWARSAAAAGGAATQGGAGFPPMNPLGSMPGMSPGAEGFTGFTPEAMRRMQNAFFEAMAQHAEQWMKSPQFLESLKRSMDRALDFRRQMDDFLQSNMATAFEAATGGANSEVMGAIRQTASQIEAQMSRLHERLDAIEARTGGAPTRASKSTAKSGRGAEGRSASRSRSSGSAARRASSTASRRTRP